MIDRERLTNAIRMDEGVRQAVYIDTLGNLTVGVGRLLGRIQVSADGKPEIVEAVDIPLEIVNTLFNRDTEEAVKTARRLFPTYDDLSARRQEVLVNMAFNLGHRRLSGFKKMRDAVNRHNFARAADEMLDSLWATQVGSRAVRLAAEMRTG